MFKNVFHIDAGENNLQLGNLLPMAKIYEKKFYLMWNCDVVLPQLDDKYTSLSLVWFPTTIIKFLVAIPIQPFIEFMSVKVFPFTT